jgi:ribosomal peptide maturation radical SAM protein 1
MPSVEPRAVLINPPWGAVTFPSIHVGLLKRCLESKGLACDAVYANLWLLEEIDPTLYLSICEQYAFLGEWLFSHALFGELQPGGAAAFFEAFRKIHPNPEESLGQDCEARMDDLRRRVIPAYLDRCLERVDWGRYAVVGLTCTFEQIIPALALARRIKGRYPDVKIVLGGSQMDDPMGKGFHEAFDWVDYVVMGEGEEVFPALVERIYAGRSAEGLPGVVFRGADGRTAAHLPQRQVRDLDQFPIPDYSDYFSTLNEVLGPRRSSFPRPVLLLETSKGCWWGEMAHCVFCSLNDSTIAYRAKSPERILREILEQSRAWKSFEFRAVDSIFDKRFFDELLPRLEGHDFEFYFECKSNMKREQLERMAAAGITEFLAGVDSLSTPILRLMRKGVSMLQNVELLKWSRYGGMSVDYSLLYRCPGETPEMYAEMEALFPRISHLEPPRDLRKLALLRFSPFHESPEEFGISNVRPRAIYEHLFPKDVVPLERTAFTFDADWQADAGALLYLDSFRRAYEDWKGRFAGGARLEWRKGSGFIKILDSRYGNGRQESVRYDGWSAELYEFCDQAARSRSDILRRFAAESESAVLGVLAEMTERGFLLREGEQYLGLALPSVKSGSRNDLERSSGARAVTAVLDAGVE